MITVQTSDNPLLAETQTVAAEDTDFIGGLEATLSEWESPADEAAYRSL